MCRRTSRRAACTCGAPSWQESRSDRPPAEAVFAAPPETAGTAPSEQQTELPWQTTMLAPRPLRPVKCNQSLPRGSNGLLCKSNHLHHLKICEVGYSKFCISFFSPRSGCGALATDFRDGRPVDLAEHYGRGVRLVGSIGTNPDLPPAQRRLRRGGG